jgi:protein-S-isoprenylcysteine O-methyltransferase Ste14
LNALWVALGTPLLASVFAFIFEPGMVTWSSFPLAPPLRWAGAALGLTAVFLILEVHLELGANFSPTLRLLPDHSLVTTGLYRWVRHPMYSSYFLLFAGAGLLTANWLIGGTGLGIIISQMTIRVPREERILQERFGGAHGVYAAATGKFFPRIRPW